MGSTVMRRERKWLVAGIASAVLLGASGCSAEGGWQEPDKGQAAVLLKAEAGAKGVAWLAFGGSPDGLAAGPDGAVYGSGAALAEITKDRKARHILEDEVHGTGGLVVLSRNAFVVGKREHILRITADGAQTVLAGASGAPRKSGQAVPKSVPAKEVHFGTALAKPFGTRPDGSILITDNDVVWQLKDGRLTRVYQVTADSAGGSEPSVGTTGTVDRAGTVYVAPRSSKKEATLGNIVTVRQGGTVGKVALPKRVAEVGESLASLNVSWMTGDGGDGIYVHAYGKSGSYVIHLESGRAQAVAKAPERIGSGKECKEGNPVDALDLPCFMPTALVYSSGSLILAGDASYVLKIPVK